MFRRRRRRRGGGKRIPFPPLILKRICFSHPLLSLLFLLKRGTYNLFLLHPLPHPLLLPHSPHPPILLREFILFPPHPPLPPHIPPSLFKRIPLKRGGEERRGGTGNYIASPPPPSPPPPPPHPPHPFPLLKRIPVRKRRRGIGKEEKGEQRVVWGVLASSGGGAAKRKPCSPRNIFEVLPSLIGWLSGVSIWIQGEGPRNNAANHKFNLHN